MNSRFAASYSFVLPFFVGALIAATLTSSSSAQVLVGDPFITSYENWVDPALERNGNWRLSLYNPTLMETSDAIPSGNNPPAATNNGSYVPTLLIQDAVTTPATYDLAARMYTSDDDGFGLVFGYQDVDNYFRVFFRAQANGNLGGTTGTSVQKVVNGVVTQISPAGTGAGNTAFPTFGIIDNRTPIDARVEVDGQNYAVYVAGVNNDMPLASGSDPDLMPGKVGVQSWAQQNFGSVAARWGTEVESVSVSDSSGVLYNGTFDSMPVQWQPLYMANSNGVRTNDPPSDPAIIIGDDRGSFGLDINDPWIYQQTNGFEWATTTAPNVDFIGPAVVVDESGSENFADYEMRVRLGGRDNDGLGVLVRAQDDDNFYRIHFATEAIGATEQRAPRGLSVQKVNDGVWSELFRDDQENPLFVYENGPAGSTPATGLNMFDLLVRAVGNTLDIQVTDHMGNVYDYPLITDNNDPLLTGTVGLTTWGDEHVYFGRYGGVAGTALVTVIPEPASALLLALGTVMLGIRRRARVC